MFSGVRGQFRNLAAGLSATLQVSKANTFRPLRYT